MSDIDKDQLKRLVLDHYKNPRNRVSEPMTDASVVERGHNPQCGDEIEVGLYIEDQIIRDIKFRGRGCSICIATASIMTEHIKGQSIPASTQLATTTLHWLKHEINTSANAKGITNTDTTATPPIAPPIPAMAIALNFPIRWRCTSLAWQALHTALTAGAQAS